MYVTATCHTAGCMNAGIAIDLGYDEAPPDAVYCGPCGQPIEDVTDHPDADPAADPPE